MRIFQAFMVLVCTGILFMIPAGDAIYAFRTNAWDDIFQVTTDAGVTTANLTIQKSIYDDDESTIELTSDLSTDDPAFVSYNPATKVVALSGLSENATRQLTIAYDITSINNAAIDILLNILPIIWILVLVAFPCLALAAIFMGRA